MPFCKICMILTRLWKVCRYRRLRRSRRRGHCNGVHPLVSYLSLRRKVRKRLSARKQADKEVTVAYWSVILEVLREMNQFDSKSPPSSSLGGREEMPGRDMTRSLPRLDAWLCDASLCARRNEMKHPRSASNLQGGEKLCGRCRKQY